MFGGVRSAEKYVAKCGEIWYYKQKETVRKMIMKKLISIIILCAILAAFAAPSAFAAESDFSRETLLAESLKSLGIFKGVSDTEFELDRAPTRAEALVMLIRLLGKENEALSSECVHPFTDAPEWADKYIGYAFENGLTKGISETEFAGNHRATREMYLTFVLRALGYSDSEGGDFLWNAPFELAEKTGIISASDMTSEFLRAEVVKASYNAMSTRLKNEEKTLGEKLISEGVFSKEAYDVIFNPEEEPDSSETEKPEKEDDTGLGISRTELLGDVEIYIGDMDFSTMTSSERSFEIFKHWIAENSDYFYGGQTYLVYKIKGEETFIYTYAQKPGEDEIRISVEQFPEEGGAYLLMYILNRDGSRDVTVCSYYESRNDETPVLSGEIHQDRDNVFEIYEFDNFKGRPDEDKKIISKAYELIPKLFDFTDAVMNVNIGYFGCPGVSSLGFDEF